MPAIVPDEDTWAAFDVTTLTTGPFNFGFQYMEKADLEVTVDNVVLALSAWNLTTGSAVDAGGYDGGTFSLNTAVEDCRVVIARKSKVERDANLSASQLNFANINSLLNRYAYSLQEFKRDIARALLVSYGASGTVTDPDDVAAVAAIAAEIENLSGIDAEILILAGLSSEIAAIAALGVSELEDIAAGLAGKADTSAVPYRASSFAALKALSSALLAGIIVVGGARGGTFEVVEDTAGNVTAALAADLGEGVNVALTNGGGTKYARRVHEGEYHADWWAAAPGLPGLAAANRAAFQHAMDYIYTQGGGRLKIREQTYWVDDELYVWQRCWLVSSANGFVSQYVTAAAQPKGGCIFLADAAGLASGEAVVRFRLRGTWDAGGGFFRDAPLSGQVTGDRNSDYRHFGGIENVTVWGNRSLNQNPTITDVNATGHCVRVDGARYISVLGCALMFAAQNNLNFSSYNYGGGAISSNNAFVRGNAILQSAGVGAALAGGDSHFMENTVGYCGSTGVSVSAWGIVAGNLIWNNVGAGVSVNNALEAPTITGNKIYDNRLSGINVASGNTKATIVGNTIVRNNQAENASPAERSGIFIASTATSNLVIVGNKIGNDGGDPPNRQDYGVYFNSALTVAIFEGNELADNIVDDLVLAAATNIRLHVAGIGSNQPLHPGFTMEGHIAAAGNRITSAQAFTNNAWATKTVAAGVIACGNDQLITLVENSNVDVTDITTTLPGIPTIIIRQTGTATVTFKQNTAKLRLNSGADTPKGQHRSINLTFVSGSVWQET